jgi:hypothetical protein
LPSYYGATHFPTVLSWLLTKSRPQNTNLLAKLNTLSPSEAKRRLTDFRYNGPDHINGDRPRLEPSEMKPISMPFPGHGISGFGEPLAQRLDRPFKPLLALQRWGDCRRSDARRRGRRGGERCKKPCSSVSRELLRGWNATRRLFFAASLCVALRPDETAGPDVERRLKAQTYDCVVIGAGIRLPPHSLSMFEAVINAVHRAAPDAAIAFNTRPEDSADAAARWLKAD